MCQSSMVFTCMRKLCAYVFGVRALSVQGPLGVHLESGHVSRATLNLHRTHQYRDWRIYVHTHHVVIRIKHAIANDTACVGVFALLSQTLGHSLQDIRVPKLSQFLYLRDIYVDTPGSSGGSA